MMALKLSRKRRDLEAAFSSSFSVSGLLPSSPLCMSIVEVDCSCTTP
jgi:hypothetical protein